MERWQQIMLRFRPMDIERHATAFGNQTSACDLIGHSTHAGRPPMKTSLLAGAAVLAGTCYAMAADFYVVQDTATKQCRVAEQRPTGPAVVIVGAERSYASQAEAEAALKASSICNQTTAQAPAGGTTTAQAPAGGGAAVGVGDTKNMTDV